jgi:hypothetical protein
VITPSRLPIYVLHLFGNAGLLLLAYYWLGMSESDALHLAFSAFVILSFWLGTIWLHGTALVLFRPLGQTTVFRAAVRALRHLLPLFVLTAFVVFLYLTLAQIYDAFGHEAFTIGSYSTMKLRRPVPPGSILKAFHSFIWIIEWIVVPVLTLLLASEVAEKGWAGFRVAAFRRSRDVWFSLRAAFLVVAAVHLPVHLYISIPTVSNFSLQMVSFVARIGLGYLLFTAGFLAAEFVASAGMPPDTQPSTVVSP